MGYNSVTIKSRYSANPSKQQNYTVTCNSHRIFTTVTSKPSVVRKWVTRIRYRHRHQFRNGRLIVGLGVQWPPCKYPIAATLQLCVGHQCLIFQLRHADRSPLVLHRLLSAPDVTVVGVWNYRDAETLRKSKHRLRVSRLEDMRHLASDKLGCDRQTSMAKLADIVLGFHGVEKKERVGRSAWNAKWLSEKQVEYACVDAFVSFMIAKTLKVWKWSE